MSDPARTDFIYILGFYLFFALQFLAALIVFILPLKKRRMFPLRFALSAAALVGLSFLWSETAAQFAALRILRYLVLFACGYGVIYVSCAVNAWAALFCAIGSYVMQHIAYRFASPVLYNIRTLPSGVVLTLYFAVFAAVYLIGYFLLVRKLKRSDELFGRDRFMIIFALAVLLCITVLSGIYDSDAGEKSATVKFVCEAFDVMSCVFIFGLMLTMFRRRNTQSEFDSARLLWEKEKRQYETTRENVNLINIKCHDMKRYIERLKDVRGEVVSDKDIAEMESLLDFYDRAVRTGNEVIDVVLADRSLQCEKLGIRLSCMTDGKKFGFMQPADIYSLFDNIIDNAVAAVRVIEDESRRVISLTTSESMGMLFLHAENYFEGELELENGLPKTTKSDRDYHGYGMKSIARVVRNYGGELQLKTADGIFSLDCVFPLGNRHK